MKRFALTNKLDNIFEDLLIGALPTIKGLDDKEYSPEDIFHCLSYDLIKKMKEDYYDLVCNLVIDTTNKDFDITCEDTFNDIVDKYLPEIYEEIKIYSNPEILTARYESDFFGKKKKYATRLYKLEHHFDKWILEEGYVVFAPNIHFFSELKNKKGDRTGEEVNITNLYDGALIYFDKDGEYHMIDEEPLVDCFHALMGSANTDDPMLQQMAMSMVDEYLTNPDIIPKEEEQEYVKSRGE